MSLGPTFACNWPFSRLFGGFWTLKTSQQNFEISPINGVPTRISTLVFQSSSKLEIRTMEFTACYPPVKTAQNKPAPPYKQADKPDVRCVKYVPVGYVDTHSKAVGYLLWLVGFTGAHRFYYGRPLTGILWFFTFGLFGIGWLVDLFLIPFMDRDADKRFSAGGIDYNLSWILLLFFGYMGIHRFYQAKIFTGLIYFFTFGLFGVGYIYDVLTLNDQVSERNYHRQVNWMT